MTQSFDLKQLAGIRGLCLSIIEPLIDGMPHTSGPEARLLGAVKGADALLEERGYDRVSREEFLRPIVNIARNTNWSAGTGSFVVFRSPGFTNAGFWPVTLDANARLADEFFILPLIETQRSAVWLLALSLDRVRLLHGEGHGLSEVPLPVNARPNLREFEGFDAPDHDLEGRSASGPSHGAMHAIRFGTGSAHETHNRHIRDFFVQVDRAIQHLIPEGEPLIIAGVAREIAIYRGVNTCRSLDDRAIQGSPDAFTSAELWARAEEILLMRTKDAARPLLAEMENAANKGLLLTDPLRILEAARAGSAERLFIDSAKLGASPLDADLVNSAAIAVIHHSGTVVCADGIPDKSSSAAVRLRYRIAPTEQKGELAVSY